MSDFDVTWSLLSDRTWSYDSLLRSDIAPGCHPGIAPVRTRRRHWVRRLLLQPATKNESDRTCRPQGRSVGGSRPASPGRCGPTRRPHRRMTQPLATPTRILGQRRAGMRGLTLARSHQPMANAAMIKVASFMIYCIVIVDQLSRNLGKNPLKGQGSDRGVQISGPVWRSGRVASPVTLPDQRIEAAQSLPRPRINKANPNRNRPWTRDSHGRDHSAGLQP
jgi:hypothetical protein